MTIEGTSRAGRPERARNARGQGARLRDELLAAALRVLDRDGVEQVTLRAVARETGVAAPSIYRQFDDLQALLAEVAGGCFASLADQITAARDRHRTPEHRLTAACGAYLAFAEAHPHRYDLLFRRDPDPQGVEPEDAAPAGAATFALLRDAVSDCLPPTGTPSALTATAAAIWVGLDGYANLHRHRPHFPWPTRQVMLTRLVEDHLAGTR